MTQGDGNGSLTTADLYEIAVAEYRFQATFNWSRTQYLLAFNVGILAAATALGSSPGRGRGAALVFVLGVVAAGLSVTVVRVQHGYYRAAREHMRRVEKAIGLPEDRRLDTTAKLGRRSRTISVNTIVYVLLGSVIVANMVGVVLIVHRP